MRARFCLLLIFLFSHAGLFQAKAESFRFPDDIPILTAPVTDLAQLISPEETIAINRLLFRLYESGGSQIAVLTVPDLNGLTIEEASIRVTDKWKLGRGDTDRGVLVLIAKKERKIRIEVGQGNEGYLPDVIAKRIIEVVMVPAFAAGQISQGVRGGLYEIIARTDPMFVIEPGEINSLSRLKKIHRSQNFRPGLVLLLLFVILLILNYVMNVARLRGRYPRSGGFHRHQGGFGGPSSGGFGGSGGGRDYRGGGGGFSGGGASGGW